jgi:hypothetical protein
MGQEAGMKKRMRVPVLFTCACFLLAFCASLYLVLSITRISNIAGRNGWPIVAAYTDDRWLPLHIMTLDGSTVGVMLPSRATAFSGVKCFFDQDGNLYMTTDGEPKIGEKMMLPNYRCRPANIPILQAIEGSRWWVVPMNPSAKWKFENDSENQVLIVHDLVSGESRNISVRSILRPTIDPNPPQSLAADISDDGSVMTVDVWDNPGGDLTPKHKGSFYQYRFSKDKWFHVADVNSCYHFTTNPDGSIIALTWNVNGADGVQFLNITSGEIKSYSDALGPEVGKRWAAYVSPGKIPNNPTLVVLDMQDGWKEYRFPLTEVPTSYYPEFGNLIALYEP